MKTALLLLFLMGSLSSSAQKYFEGEIHYLHSYVKKDSAFDLTDIPTYPSTASMVLCKDGNWLLRYNEGMIEFAYFNHALKKSFYKFYNYDTLIYSHMDELAPDAETLLSTESLYNTDTILGKVCHRFILHTSKQKVTFIYSPEYKVNPDWYKNIKNYFYDVIYSNMKALYLGLIIESDRFISSSVAEKIVSRPVTGKSFPDLKQYATRELMK